MPKYQISHHPDGLQIEIREAARPEDQILASLQECKEGRCSCPTPEYEKLASMDVATTTDTVQIKLTAKAGVMPNDTFAPLRGAAADVPPATQRLAH